MLFFTKCNQKQPAQDDTLNLKELSEIPVLDVEFIPEKYVAYKMEKPINIDGELTESEWGNIEWTAKFDDLEGDKKSKPLTIPK